MLDYNVALAEYVSEALLQERIREAERRRRGVWERRRVCRERVVRRNGSEPTLRVDEMLAARRI